MKTALGHREYIERSHARCRAYGIGEDRVFSERILGETALAERLEASRALTVAAEPVINRLHAFVRGSGFFAILTDAEGCILKVIGDDDILAKAFSLKMVPGAFMDERSIGTNAMGTALAEGMPVQVSGEEHFVKAYHGWTCSCAPIRDSVGGLVGSVDLTGNSVAVHSHTLGMVVAAADAISTIMGMGRYAEELAASKRQTEAIIDSISAGMVTVGLDGAVKTASSYAQAMFGLGVAEIRALGARGLFDGWERVRDAMLERKCFQDEDIPVNARRNRAMFSLSAYPVEDGEGGVRDILLVFKEVRRVRKLADRISGRHAIYTFDKILGNAPAFLEAVEFARKSADSRSTVLILGESGTGKELFAQAIHNLSDRRDEPFVAINCSAIPRTLIESELFGYEEGAFTGAKRSGQPGKFELADGGTIFLDEIGEMPLDLQTRLLRVIEEGTVCRVGGMSDIVVQTRIIAATNKDLRAEVDRGNFRKDLFFRLNVLPLSLPPLRERPSDIPLLVDFFMGRIAKRLNKKPVPLTESYLEALTAHDWPGNVRELENLVELIINAEDLVPFPLTRDPSRFPSCSLPQPRDSLGGDGRRAASGQITPLATVEREHIARALKAFHGNVSLASKALGIGRTTLYRKMEEFGIMAV